tara:strand:+ start:74 stop:475 length:402 start_codon:yes stop_codon:yes gene_type:complete
MAITYTTSASAVFEEDFSLDLYAGTQVSDENWLDGNAGGSYPGTLTGFTAQNTDGNAVGGAKLVCGRFTTALANDETLTLSGDATRILAVIVGDNSTETAAVTLKQAISAAGVATFKVTGTSDALVTCWMIVA